MSKDSGLEPHPKSRFFNKDVPYEGERPTDGHQAKEGGVSSVCRVVNRKSKVAFRSFFSTVFPDRKPRFLFSVYMQTDIFVGFGSGLRMCFHMATPLARDRIWHSRRFTRNWHARMPCAGFRHQARLSNALPRFFRTSIQQAIDIARDLYSSRSAGTSTAGKILKRFFSTCRFNVAHETQFMKARENGSRLGPLSVDFLVASSTAEGAEKILLTRGKSEPLSRTTIITCLATMKR